ncbi:restriction endonuclease subunit S [Aureivirga marina]|uniref:restriction endonuclease subunit S n=1 Tax=Aureivirga marina TaxID=1182451 RepID=UPI0018CB5F77|nr:restriction endonuclease subunit S [Aureivirga marina]
MAEFKLSDKVNPNKVFILKTSEIEKRLDPFYYIPEIKELEKKVRTKDIKPLRHFVKNVSSGATPKTTEKEKYYSDKENGIPFLRVQNLSPTGILDYEDCKYINKETHEGYLKRSQVNGGDLLIKITGVGRMAVASVAPDGFIGNTNQHMVIIKTGSKEVSTILASYLNSDIGEKLASRRATGGTRPALDYPALLSIPIFYDERILTITKESVDKKNKKQKEAKDLLASIDTYLLDELGITLPEKDNSLENRIFTTKLSEVSGVRFDAISVNNSYLTEALKAGKYPVKKLKKITKNIRTGTTPSSKLKPYENKGIVFLRNSDLQNGEITLKNVKYVKESLREHLTFSTYNDIIICIAGTVGISAINKQDVDISINQNVSSITIKKEKINIEFINYYFNTKYNISIVRGFCSVATILYLNNENLFNIPIPIPPIEKQTEIANHITDIRNQAKQLELDAEQIMIEAKTKVEQIILG